MLIISKSISYVGKSDLFNQNSYFFGYRPDKIAPFSKELFTMLSYINNQKSVEIYRDDRDRLWKRIKSSAYDGGGILILEYIELFHGRVRDDSLATTELQRRLFQDPLIVFTFQPNPYDIDLDPVLIAEFILDHNQYVGRVGHGKKIENLSNLRKRVLGKIKLASGRFTKI